MVEGASILYVEDEIEFAELGCRAVGKGRLCH